MESGFGCRDQLDQPIDWAVIICPSLLDLNIRQASNLPSRKGLREIEYQ